MLRAVTIGYPHDATANPTVIAGPELGVEQHLASVKKLGASRTHPNFSKIEVWDSNSGVRKTYKFLSKEEAARRAKLQKEEADRIAKTDKK